MRIMSTAPSPATRARIQQWTFTVLLLAVTGLLGWLSHRYYSQFDWTSAGRNTLTAPSQEIVARLDGPLIVTAFVRENATLRSGVRQLTDRYQRHKSDIRVEFVNPDRFPELVRELGIAVDGELVLEYSGRTEHVVDLTEKAFTTALQRLSRSQQRWLVYLSGHGERDLLGIANHDLGNFGQHLKERGLHVQALNLAEAGAMPANTSLLVVSQPQVDMLPGEITVIRDYIDNGGNLLWLGDPGNQHRSEQVLAHLGVRQNPGMVVDPQAKAFGVNHPAFVVVSAYGLHPAVAAFKLVTVFPQAASLSWQPTDFETTSLLRTGIRAWTETGDLSGEVSFDQDYDLPGPVDIGLSLTRERSDAAGARNQRIVIVGDGDFLANAYLGNGGNLELGMNMVNWLSDDDVLIDIQTRIAVDVQFNPTRLQRGIIVIGAPIVLPIVLLALGLVIWRRRRR